MVEIAWLGVSMVGEARLDMADRVIAEITGETAAEARQAGQRRRAKALHVGAQEGERIAVETLDDSTAVFDVDVAAVNANANLCGQADERIAAEPLAADDRLQ